MDPKQTSLPVLSLDTRKSDDLYQYTKKLKDVNKDAAVAHQEIGNASLLPDIVFRFFVSRDNCGDLDPITGEVQTIKMDPKKKVKLSVNIDKVGVSVVLLGSKLVVICFAASP